MIEKSYSVGEAVRDLTHLGGTVLTKSSATKIIERLLASERRDFRWKMAKLNWIHILKKAIENRLTSWHPMYGKPENCTGGPVSEWRNASDEVFSAVIREMERKGLIPDSIKEMREWGKEMRTGGGDKKGRTQGRGGGADAA